MKDAASIVGKLAYGMAIGYAAYAHNDHLLISATAIIIWMRWMAADDK